MPLPLRRRRRYLIMDQTLSDTPCAAGQRHVERVCVVEGYWLVERPPCEDMGIAEVLAHLRTGDRFGWGSRYDSLFALAWARFAKCTCRRGYVLGYPPADYPAKEGLVVGAVKLTDELDSMAAKERAQEAELQRQLATAGPDPHVSDRLAFARDFASVTERLSTWIKENPELSNALAGLVSGKVIRARHRKFVTSLKLVAICLIVGWLLSALFPPSALARLVHW